MDFHGSGTLYKPTLGPIVTLSSGTEIPASIHRPWPAAVKSVRILAFGDAHGLCQLAGSESIPPIAPCQHNFHTIDGLDSADQYRRRKAFSLGDRVQHPVMTVREIDIGMPRRPIHNLCARCASGFGMTAQVCLADVGFRLGDEADEFSTIQNP